MDVAQRTAKGIAWSAASGGLQLAVSLATFTVVASQLAPAEIGAYGVAILLIGFAEMASAGLFSESLQQRQSLDARHANATFWLTLTLTSIATVLLIVSAGWFADVFQAPIAELMIMAMALFLPLSALACVNDGLLGRQLRHDVLARVGARGSLVSGSVAIAGIALGAGAWSLVAAEISAKLYRTIHIASISTFVPGRVRDLGAIRDLMSYNASSVILYGAGFLDGAAARFFTGLILGPAALGYFMIASRGVQLASSLILGPMATITLASTSRLRDNTEALHAHILSLYRWAGLIAYPAFAGALVLANDLLVLFGEKWLPAVFMFQCLLVACARLTTGVFNMSLLRACGDEKGPRILILSGLFLSVTLLPAAAQVGGLAGVGIAIVLRHWATWPLGIIFVKNATGLSAGRQLYAHIPYLVSAIAMASCVAAASSLVAQLPLELRILSLIAVGLSIYTLLLALIDGAALTQIMQFVRTRLERTSALLARPVRGPRP